MEGGLEELLSTSGRAVIIPDSFSLEFPPVKLPVHDLLSCHFPSNLTSSPEPLPALDFVTFIPECVHFNCMGVCVGGACLPVFFVTSHVTSCRLSVVFKLLCQYLTFGFLDCLILQFKRTFRHIFLIRIPVFLEFFIRPLKTNLDN